MLHLKPSYSTEPDDIHSPRPSEQTEHIYITAFKDNCVSAAAVEQKLKANLFFYLFFFCPSVVITEVNKTVNFTLV